MAKSRGKVTFSRRERILCIAWALAMPFCIIVLTTALKIFFSERFTLDAANEALRAQAMLYHARYHRDDTSDVAAINRVKNQFVLVTIDDETLADPRFNKWPIPRERYAEMIKILDRARARAVGLDILFTESQNKKSDEALAQALHSSPSTLLVNAVTSQKGELTVQKVLPLLTEGWSQQQQTDRIGLTVENDPILSIPLVAWVNGEKHFSFDALLAARALNVPTSSIQDHSTEGWGAGYVEIGDRRIPVVDGAMQINYQWGGAQNSVGVKDDSSEKTDTTQFAVNPIPLVALWDMDDHDLARFFKDRVVLVGVTALAGEDIKNTPVGRMSGVEVHLNALVTLLSGRFLSIVPGSTILVVTFALVLLVGFVLPLLDARVGSVMCLALVLALLGFPFPIANLYTIWFPPVLPAISVLMVYCTDTILLIRAEQRAKLLMKTLFEKATPVREDDVIEFLLSGKTDADEFEPQLEVRERTVLFSDIRDYTVMSESMNADQVMKTLNHYYSEMQTVINECGGKIWEYVGDAQMVIFGEKTHGRYPPECKVKAEYENMNAADQAVHAAVNMVARLEQLNAEARQRGLPVLDIGIGINSGQVSLGTIKNKGKLVFACIGDTTNVAARMQAMSKDLKCRILVSQSTYQQLEDVYLNEKVENVKVKGKAEPMTVYRIFAGQQAREREAVTTP
jgi:adenylate cyclase